MHARIFGRRCAILFLRQFIRRRFWTLTRKLARRSQHHQGRADRTHTPFKLLSALRRWAFSLLLGGVIGYGYRPFRALIWALVLIVYGAIRFDAAHNAGAMVPNNPFLLKTEWANALEGNAVKQGPKGLEVIDKDCGDPYACFYKSVPDFQPFNPLVYSIDTFVPLVNLHQEPHWIPQPEGKDARGIGPVFISGFTSRSAGPSPPSSRPRSPAS